MMHLPDNDSLSLLAGMVTRQDGTLRWPVIIGGVITATIIGIAAWMMATTSTLAKLEARQEIVLQRLSTLESSAHPATSKRFTADDAREMETRITLRIDRLESRLDRKDDKH